MRRAGGGGRWFELLSSSLPLTTPLEPPPPPRAPAVVEDLGMSIQQFNDMLERSRRDPIMRIRMRLAWNAHKKTQAAQL